MKLKFSNLFLAIFMITLINSYCRRNKEKNEEKNRENDSVLDPLAIHIALGQTQQQIQGEIIN